MAFDRPLEADRVDDLGLLSTFVRAPIVGPIMWMLGRNLVVDDDDKDKENQLIPQSPNKKRINSNDSFPDMSSSTISDIISNSSSDQDCTLNHGRWKDKLTEESNRNETTQKSLKRHRNRKMSWSDESGQNLVEYCDMSQSSSSQGTPPSLHCPVHNKKPIKSAMKRSSGKVPSNPKQCIPSGLSGGSIVMPTGGGIQQYHQQQQQQQPLHHQQQPSSANPTGYYSPQYGWYISMTPPTPPKYAYVDTPSSTVENKDGRQTKNEISQQKQQDPKQQILRPSHQVPSRPVFTRNLKGIPNNTSGWPSVPL